MIAAALCGVALATAEGDRLSDALTLVDRLAWAADDREVRQMVRDAVRDDSVYARSLRVPDRALLRGLEHPTLYAAEAELSEVPSAIGPRVLLRVREAVVFQNSSRQPLDHLVLRVYPNELRPVHLQGIWVDNRRVPGFLDGSVLDVRLREAVAPGDTVRVLLQLTMEVPPFDPARGLEADVLDPRETGAFGTAAGQIGLGYWLPLVTPVDGEGRFDERPIRPNTEHALFEPALFHVVLDLPADLEVGTTGVQVLRREEGGHQTVVAVAGAAREFAVQLGHGLDILETEVGGTQLRVLYPADEPAMGRHLLEYAEGALRACTQAFGPLSAAEIDVVEAPIRIALGMEYPGLVTVDAHHKRGSYARNAVHEWTVAHEIAHQWWSAEVGSEPGTSPWLDEGLASFSAALYWEGRYGREALDMRHELDVIEPIAALRERGSPDLPADLEAWRYDLHQYSAIVYGRAALFFEALSDVMGREALLAGLRRYHLEQRGRIADADDLLDALEAEAPDPAVVRALYERWITEGHGYEDLLED